MTTPLTWHHRPTTDCWLGVDDAGLIAAKIRPLTPLGVFEVRVAGRSLNDPIRCTSLAAAKGVAEANVGVPAPTAEKQTKAFIDRARRGERRAT